MNYYYWKPFICKYVFFLSNFFILFLFQGFYLGKVFSQNKKNLKFLAGNNLSEGLVTYQFISQVPKIKPMVYTLFCVNGRSRFTPIGNKINEQIYTDFRQQAFIHILTLKSRKLFLVSSFEKLLPSEETGDTLTIAGKFCHKFIAMDIGDKLESWVWKESSLRGSPNQILTPESGLVMAIDRNGKREWQVTKIDFRKISNAEILWPSVKGPFVSTKEYENARSESERTEVPIMNHELVVLESENIPSFNHFSRIERYARGTLLLKKVRIPSFKKDDRVFLKLSTYSNGDPLPRTGSVFLILPGKKSNLLSLLQKRIPEQKKNKSVHHTYAGIKATSSFSPPLELMRFSSPYGVRFYNKSVIRKNYTWADSVSYRQDLSDLKEILGNELWLGVYIAGGDTRGNVVSLNLEIYPEAQQTGVKKIKQFIEPLIYTVNPLAVNGEINDEVFKKDSITLKFTIPDGLKNVRLRYISTSSLQKKMGEERSFEENEIQLDDEIIAHYVPLRNDCGSYRIYNPASPVDKYGFFESDYSRAGWCPGAITVPVYFPLPELDEGDHSLKITVPNNKGNGISQENWEISMCLMGDFE